MGIASGSAGEGRKKEEQMNGLKPIKMPSAKEKVAAELRKAILSRQMKEGEILSLDSVASQLNVSAMPVRADPASEE